MTLAEKTSKLLGHTIIISAVDKKMWLDTLPRMDDSQVQVLYDVLVAEVKAWKKEGISILHDSTVEAQLLPPPDHGASLDTLKARLTGAPPAPKPAPKPTPPPPPAPKPEATEESKEEEAEDDFVLGETKKEAITPDKNAWMLSSEVVVPKKMAAVTPKPLAVPKVRNRVPKHGLSDLGKIRAIDDLQKIEAAHLRQGPLRDQIATIHQRIMELAAENDLLPVNVIPVFERSPLFQTYLKAGSMMIDRNMGEDKQGLDQVMAEMEMQGQETLTLAEFEGMADLRKELESSAGL